MERPPTSTGSAPFQADEALCISDREPPGPEVSSLYQVKWKASKRSARTGEAPEGEPTIKKEKPPCVSPIKIDSQVFVTVTISNDDMTDPESTSSSTPRSTHVQSNRLQVEDQIPREAEEEKSTSYLESLLPSGVDLQDLLPRRYETYALDHDWVHRVRSSLLGLEVGTTPSD